METLNESIHAAKNNSSVNNFDSISPIKHKGSHFSNTELFTDQKKHSKNRINLIEKSLINSQATLGDIRLLCFNKNL